MALKAILEIVLQLDSFRNVDLLKQGLYQVQISIYAEDEQKVTASPFEMMTLGSGNKTMGLLPARIDDQSDSFCSSTVLIRYCDEEMKMTDACLFHLELDLSSTPQLTLEARLLFSDLQGRLNFEAPLNQLKTVGDCIDFSTMSVTELKVINPLEGVHQYTQFVFSDPHICILAGSIHTSLMDYRLRLVTPRCDLELPKAIGKYLFSKEKGEMKAYVGSDETDKKYARLMAPIARCHGELRQFVCSILKCCLPHNSALTLPELPEPLALPLYRSPFSTSIPKKFSEAVASHDPVFISAALLTEVNLIASQVCQLFYAVKTLLKAHPGSILSMLKEQYMDAVRDRCGESIFRDSHVVQFCPLTADNELGERHKVQASIQRRNQYYCHLIPMPVHDPSLFPLPEAHPILFEDNYVVPMPRQSQRNRSNSDHVIVLVHGYQGTSMDMKMIRNALGLVYPQALFLCSTVNEENTEGCILEMGKNLAKEVLNFIDEWSPNGKLSRLSFVAHSLGGLIVRASLPHLEELSTKLHSFISLSCPHLGYMFTSSRLVDAGMWLLKAWNRSLCLQQLSMTEERNQSQCVLYRLSGFIGMSWFKHVVLIGSHQDSYAPFESVRVEVSQKAAADLACGKVYEEMAMRMLGGLTPAQLCRLDVNFKLPSKSLDSIIGRAAHIQFLENEGFLRLLAFRYPEFFI